MNFIALLETLVNGLMDAEDKFFSNPRDLHTLESSVRTATNDFARNWMGRVSRLPRHPLDSALTPGPDPSRRKQAS